MCSYTQRIKTSVCWLVVSFRASCCCILSCRMSTIPNTITYLDAYIVCRAYICGQTQAMIFLMPSFCIENAFNFYLLKATRSTPNAAVHQFIHSLNHKYPRSSLANTKNNFWKKSKETLKEWDKENHFVPRIASQSHFTQTNTQPGNKRCEKFYLLPNRANLKFVVLQSLSCEYKVR